MPLFEKKRERPSKMKDVISAVFATQKRPPISQKTEKKFKKTGESSFGVSTPFGEALGFKTKQKPKQKKRKRVFYKKVRR